jgi:hypothetical protein
MRAIVTEVFSGLANPEMSRPSAPDCIDFGIDPLRLPRRVAVFVLGGFPFALLPSAPPRAPAASCASPYPRQPRQLHVDHGYPTSSTTTIHPPVWLHGTKGYHPHEFLAGFLSSRSVYITSTFQLRGMSVHWLSPTASSLVSPSVVLPL